MKQFKAGIDKVYKSLVTESEVPEVTTDDFVMFLQWMAKRTNEDGEALYTPLNIADVVAEPHHYSKEFTEYQSWRESEFGNHILHPNEDTAPLVPRKEPEIGGRGTITITKPDPKDGERKLLIAMSDPDGVPDTKYGGIDFKDLSTGETVTSPERIRAQLERALRFELGFDVTSAATNASRAAGGGLTEKGKWDVSILWNKERDPDTGEFYPLESGNTWDFKLVPTQLK